jgi:general secretion pathway protein D
LNDYKKPRGGLALRATGVVAAVVLLLLLLGCSARKAYNEGQDAVRLGQWETAVQRFTDAVEQAPKKPRYKIALERTRLEASQHYFDRGQEYANTGLLEDAAIFFNKTIMFDPSNQYAIDELAKVMRAIDKRREESEDDRTEFEQMKDDAVTLESPRLDPLSDAKISFYYKDTSIKTIYEQLGKVGGINIIFDKQIQDQDFSIDVAGVTFEDILNILSLANGHFIKVIDETTILIIPDNQAKRKEYEDQVIRTFYLSSADIKDVQTLLRTILSKTRTIAVNPELNAITIMDTPKSVALASRIIESNDKNKSEVVVGIELLEVNRQRVQTLGIELTSHTVTQSLRGTGDGGGWTGTVNDLRYLNSTDWILTLPSIIYNFLKTDSDTRFLARPQLRVAEGETAKIHIGDKVPIPTTTFNFTQTDNSGNVIPVTSYTYQNVGIQIEVTPRVHHNREVSLELKVEVSSIGATTQSGQPTIGNREINTVIRLKDGQTSLLAGLFKETSTESNTGVPGVSDIPFLKRILGKNTADNKEDDIILTITPHIVRIPTIIEDDLESIYLGMVDKEPFKAQMTNLYHDNEEKKDKGDEEQSEGGAAGTTEPAASSPESASDLEVGSVEGWQEQETDWETEAGQSDDPFAGGSGGRDDRTRESDSGESGEDRGGESDRTSEPGGGDPPRGPARVSFVPGSVDTLAGGVFSLAVNIENAWNVAHTPFYITYDPQLVEYAGAAEGTFMNSDGTSTTFQATATNGRVLVGLSRFGRGAGAEGAGTLATFQFKALAPGTGVLAFTNNSVKDPSMRNLPSIWTPAQLRVQ